MRACLQQMDFMQTSTIASLHSIGLQKYGYRNTGRKPPELRKAHHQNDMAVMQAYGFTKGSEAYKSEAACVAELMKLYQKKVEEIEKR